MLSLFFTSDFRAVNCPLLMALLRINRHVNGSQPSLWHCNCSVILAWKRLFHHQQQTFVKPPLSTRLRNNKNVQFRACPREAHAGALEAEQPGCQREKLRWGPRARSNFTPFKNGLHKGFLAKQKGKKQHQEWWIEETGLERERKVKRKQEKRRKRTLFEHLLHDVRIYIFFLMSSLKRVLWSEHHDAHSKDREMEADHLLNASWLVSAQAMSSCSLCLSSSGFGNVWFFWSLTS